MAVKHKVIYEHTKDPGWDERFAQQLDKYAKTEYHITQVFWADHKVFAILRKLPLEDDKQ